MIIYFLRHASAGEHLANPKKDEKRALDKEGIDSAARWGRALAASRRRSMSCFSSLNAPPRPISGWQ